MTIRKGQRSRVNRSNASNQKRQQGGPAATGRVLFFTDIHFPFQDAASVERLLDQVASEQFETIICGGDGVDAYSVSKYDPDPARLLSLQDELDQLGDFLGRINELQPNARKLYLVGNHEERIPHYVRRKGPALESLRCLKLDELLQTRENGFELHGREGVLIDDTRYKHGDRVAKGAGNSVIKEMEHHWRNVFMGHCHRRAVRRIRKDDREFVGGEAGGLMDLSPEYVSFPDWQPGWLVNTHHADGVEVEEVFV